MRGKIGAGKLNDLKILLKAAVQLLILIGIYQCGNFVSGYFHLPIPGNVIGIVMLLILLWTGVIKVRHIELAANWLLKHLGFFFIPISVGLMTLGDLSAKNSFFILIILIISALIGLVTTGKSAELIITKKEKGNVHYHDHAL